MLGTAVVTSASLNSGSYASSDYYKHLWFSIKNLLSHLFTLTNQDRKWRMSVLGFSSALIRTSGNTGSKWWLIVTSPHSTLRTAVARGEWARTFTLSTCLSVSGDATCHSSYAWLQFCSCAAVFEKEKMVVFRRQSTNIRDKTNEACILEQRPMKQYPGWVRVRHSVIITGCCNVWLMQTLVRVDDL